jgi:hypothetical protein
VQTARRSIARLPSTSTAADSNERILSGTLSVALGLGLASAGGLVFTGGVRHRSATMRALFRNLSVR